MNCPNVPFSTHVPQYYQQLITVGNTQILRVVVWSSLIEKLTNEFDPLTELPQVYSTFENALGLTSKVQVVVEL